MTDVGAIVIALGGNAISPENEEGNVPQQFRRTRQTAEQLAPLAAAGRPILINHGNGPQVGNVLRRVELASHELYTLPLDICGAHTQGGMGYMIAQCINNELSRRGVARHSSCLMTSVEVSPDDPEFRRPTKPIGRFYDEARARELQTRYAWNMIETPGHGFRRVVPSPRPVRVLEVELIRKLVELGEILVAGGGGGVPVVRRPDGDHMGVEAVIDKDRTAALLAIAIKAETLLIQTSVPRVAIDFGRPTEKYLDRLSLRDARRRLGEGQFPPGSMGPKIEAAIAFLEAGTHPAASVVICDMASMHEALAGRTGTTIAAGTGTKFAT